MAYEYTTASLVQDELRLTSEFASTTLPSLSAVTTWIEQESNHVNDISGRNYGETIYEEYIDYDGSDRIQLKRAPIITVNSLLYSSTGALGTSDYALTATQVEDTDFVVYLERGEVRPLFNVWSPKIGDRRMLINYTAGFATIPKTIEKLATKMVAKRVWDTTVQNNLEQSSSGKSISVGSISIVKSSDFGVSQYQQLQSDIGTLKTELASGTGVLRYTNY